MCQAYPEGKMATNNVNNEFEYHTLRNGQTLNTQDFRNGQRENVYIRRDRGLHEPANYYQAYFRRERNKGEGTITSSYSVIVRPGKCSSEKNCSWWLTFRQPERKSSSRVTSLWRWLPIRLSKRQSPTTVLFRTTLAPTITLYELLIFLGSNYGTMVP